MIAPASGSPLLSRTVPVIVANPRGTLAAAGVALVVTENARAITGIVILKSFFIAAGPPDKIREDLEVKVSRINVIGLARDQINQSALLRFSASFRQMPRQPNKCSFASFTAPRQGDFAHLNSAIFGHPSDRCQAMNQCF